MEHAKYLGCSVREEFLGNSIFFANQSNAQSIDKRHYECKGCCYCITMLLTLRFYHIVRTLAPFFPKIMCVDQ